MSPTSAEQEPSRFWCHECGAAVDTRVDVASEEVCCVQCGGNFVEEIEEDDPPQDFQVEQVEDTQTQTQPPVASAEDTTRAEIRNEFGGTRPLPRPTGRAARFAASDDRRDGTPLPDLFQLLSGATGRSTRFMSSTGNPVEFYVSDSGEGGGEDPMGFLDALGGMFPMLAGNAGDYAFGNMANVINQLMQNDPNRHGAPPAAKEVVEKLPKVKITQVEVDGSAECPVCKDSFAVDDEVHRLPLKAAFEKVADAEGFLIKDQLQTLAQELDMTDALSNNEIDDIWSQILQSDKTNNGFPASSKISFDKLWRWWVSDAEYNIINLL
ncbi:hypothetical protein JG688_00003521 [Phytophthora aleatoria]|uniref:RING-type E3 ubiquitin transferase n=1 Tax=Phytophthora aleatoria TaxID=2496075 RepID=A0A8J5J2Y0_9STRA|nr:hypothetical protein JG688_00003521 [Phytophthora aleatoria]